MPQPPFLGLEAKRRTANTLVVPPQSSPPAPRAWRAPSHNPAALAPRQVEPADALPVRRWLVVVVVVVVVVERVAVTKLVAAANAANEVAV